MPVPGDVLRLLSRINACRRDDVSLAAMAALAHRSPHDLHRRFRRAVGETPRTYTARVRLARAAADLLRTDRPVALVADDHGFSGHAVFTRAFTRAFGLSPRAYRDRGLHAGSLDPAVVDAHAATVAAVAPCAGLYRTATRPTPERKDRPVSADITVTETPAIHALVMRRRVPREEIPAALGEILPALFGHATSHGLAMSGPPFTRYPEVGMGSLVIEGGVPLAAPATGELPSGMDAVTIPAGPAAVTVHKGPYETLADTYAELEAWLEREGRSVAGPPRETYLTDPGEHPDPAGWLTEISQPLH